MIRERSLEWGSAGGPHAGFYDAKNAGRLLQPALKLALFAGPMWAAAEVQ